MSVREVVFNLGTEEYGIDISLVQAIEKYTGVIPIPNAPAYIIGVLNLRGDVIPVYSLRKKLGMSEIPLDDRTQLLVAKCNDMLIGYKVDAVSEIVEIENQDIHDVPVIVRSEETRYAGAVGKKKDGMFVLIDIDNLLTEQEKEAAKTVVQQNK